MAETVCVTGASGFIAKHVVLQLLNGGHIVRGTLRDASRSEEVKKAIVPHLTEPKAVERLDFVTLDLENDTGWPEALKGCTTLMHIASPFPIAQPKDPQVLIRPAVEGTLRALGAARAAGISRVVMTSSSAAVAGARLPGGREAFDERDWTDPTAIGTSAYVQSKTLAEMAAWDFIASEGKGIALTAINPTFVLGPPLDQHFGSSVGVVQRILSGKDPLVPRLGFACVDVRDVAAIHVAAMEQPGTIGQRIIASGGEMWLIDMARCLKDAYPARGIATMVAPNFAVRMLALFDPQLRSILPSLGQIDRMNNARGVRVLGRKFIVPREALLASARFLVGEGRM